MPDQVRHDKQSDKHPAYVTIPAIMKKTKLHAISQLIRFDKPIGSLLLLWPTLWALWLAADGIPPWPILLIFIAGVFITRSAGCVINDLWDRKFDGKVKRTATRPLASGALSVKAAFAVLLLLACGALALVLCLNALTIKLAFVGVFLTALYPACKRFLRLPQLVLGLTFNWGVIMAFAAVQHHVPAIAWALYAIVNLWTMVYDTQYAMVDRDDDIKLGLHSSAILFANYDRAIVASLQLLVIAGLLLLGVSCAMRWPFYLSLVIASGLFVYQQQLTWQQQREACFKAFLNNQWVGLVIWLGWLLGN
ncbi:MAG: 4-hydroxybenzoate octaprenyltransferase [Coxiellaceae bacterium]|nr:4-hydroxybenzoate octaprenyltransferase [Coxiellaceae bacterium]